MERLDKVQAINHEGLTPYNGGAQAAYPEITLQMRVLRREVAAQALKDLWHERGCAGEPLLFHSLSQGRMSVEHHPMLLDLLLQTSDTSSTNDVRLISWLRLEAPAYAYKIAIASATILMKADLLRPASIDDRHTVPSVQCGWLSYTFAAGWSALSVNFDDGDDTEQGSVVTLVALPPDRQDEWLIFLKALDTLRSEISRKERRGRI